MSEIQEQTYPEHLGCSSLSEGLVLLPTGAIESLPVTERLRIVRAKIERANLGQKKFSVIAVTSALPREGKSVISVNLSRALGIDPIGKTLLIDCDLRKPTVHKFFDVKPNPGLSDIILAGLKYENVVRKISPGIDVLTSGTPCFDPTQTIEQPKLEKLIAELRMQYRYIILDTPPILLCPEPIRLANIADGTLLVIRAWRTEKRLVTDAVNMIGKKQFLGAVINDAEEQSRQYSYYSYYGYRRESKIGLPNTINREEAHKAVEFQAKASSTDN
jgi:capsular exopolysaccharide synthesis family protein